METDINKVLRNALTTGKVLIGTKQTVEAVKNGKAQAIVISSNCLETTMSGIKGIPLIKFPGTGNDLGVACGKPFSITVLAIIEPGDSGILSLGSMNE